MAETITVKGKAATITVKGIELSQSGTKMVVSDTHQPYPWKYYYTKGELEGEGLLVLGTMVYAAWDENRVTDDDQKTRTYRNLTAISVPTAQPASSPPQDSDYKSNGQKYTDADRVAFARKDEMYARQTACNCAVQMATAGIMEFWQDVSLIEHYILTGEKPLIAPPMPGMLTADEIRGEALLATGYVEHGRLPVPAPNPVRDPKLEPPARDKPVSESTLKHWAQTWVVPSATIVDFVRAAWRKEPSQLTSAEAHQLVCLFNARSKWLASGRSEVGLNAALASVFGAGANFATLTAAPRDFLIEGYEANAAQFAEWLAESAAEDWANEHGTLTEDGKVI